MGPGAPRRQLQVPDQRTPRPADARPVVVRPAHTRPPDAGPTGSRPAGPRPTGSRPAGAGPVLARPAPAGPVGAVPCRVRPPAAVPAVAGPAPAVPHPAIPARAVPSGVRPAPAVPCGAEDVLLPTEHLAADRDVAGAACGLERTETVRRWVVLRRVVDARQPVLQGFRAADDPVAVIVAVVAAAPGRCR